jgi:hypothetical protein
MIHAAPVGACSLDYIPFPTAVLIFPARDIAPGRLADKTNERLAVDFNQIRANPLSIAQ